MQLFRVAALSMGVLASIAGTLRAGDALTPAPTRVLIIGDSLMRLTAASMGRLLDQRGGVEHRDFTSLGSGLARLDVFDWMAKIDELVGAFGPDLVIAWFGANDNQPMRTGDETFRSGTEAWDAEYARRIGEAMDKLVGERDVRVLWLELPDMRDTREQEHAMRVNALAVAQAAAREAVTFFETRRFLSRSPGTYAPYVIGPTGRVTHIRATDGGHLSPAGADLTAGELIRHCFEVRP